MHIRETRVQAPHVTFLDTYDLSTGSPKSKTTKRNGIRENLSFQEIWWANDWLTLSTWTGIRILWLEEENRAPEERDKQIAHPFFSIRKPTLKKILKSTHQIEKHPLVWWMQSFRLGTATQPYSASAHSREGERPIQRSVLRISPDQG